MPRHHQWSETIRQLDGQEVDVIPTAQARRLASLAIVAALVGACGVAGRPSEPAPAPQPPMTVQQTFGQGGQQATAQQQDPLGLTQAQQQQLQQIAQQAQPDQSTQDAWMQKFGDLLLANQINVPALAQHLEQNRQQMIADMDKTVQALVATRNILTDEQRAKFVQLQSQQQQPQGQDPLQDLNLTAEQRQALQSVEATAVQQATAQAIGQFMQSGDQQQLRAAIQQAFSQMPEPQAVAQAMASLSLDQRKKLFGVS